MSETEKNPSASHGPIESAKNILDSVIGLLEKRLELASVELQEEKYRLFDQLFRAIVAGVLILMALIMVSFLIVVLCWDTNARIYVIGGLAVFYTSGAGWMFSVLRKRLAESPTPFSSTIEEIRKDREWFQNRN